MYYWFVIVSFTLIMEISVVKMTDLYYVKWYQHGWKEKFVCTKIKRENTHFQRLRRCKDKLYQVFVQFDI